jgi:hypothetical protein
MKSQSKEYKMKLIKENSGNMKWIKLGSWLEFLIEIITFGYGERLALLIAKRFFNSDSCGCCERKQWLNRLTNPQYDGECNQIKLF